MSFQTLFRAAFWCDVICAVQHHSIRLKSIIIMMPAFTPLVASNVTNTEILKKAQCQLWHCSLSYWQRPVPSMTLKSQSWQHLGFNGHDDVIKWKHFPCYRPFVRGIHQSPVNSPHKGQWRRAVMFPLICARINGGINNGDDGDSRRHRVQYDVTQCNG